MTKHERFQDETGEGPFTALVKKDGRWWIGGIAEIPGPNFPDRSQA